MNKCCGTDFSSVAVPIVPIDGPFVLFFLSFHCIFKESAVLFFLAMCIALFSNDGACTEGCALPSLLVKLAKKTLD